jgi:hypothetical protein
LKGSGRPGRQAGRRSETAVEGGERCVDDGPRPSWASKRWPGHTARRAQSLEKNLRVPMSVYLQAQYGSGSDGEFEREVHKNQVPENGSTPDRANVASSGAEACRATGSDFGRLRA